jgi:hypothetical protein
MIRDDGVPGSIRQCRAELLGIFDAMQDHIETRFVQFAGEQRIVTVSVLDY